MHLFLQAIRNIPQKTTEIFQIILSKTSNDAFQDSGGITSLVGIRPSGTGYFGSNARQGSKCRHCQGRKMQLVEAVHLENVQRTLALCQISCKSKWGRSRWNYNVDACCQRRKFRHAYGFLEGAIGTVNELGQTVLC